jgi:hypothetical protein
MPQCGDRFSPAAGTGALLVGALVLAAGGCGPSRPALGKVTGRVTLAGAAVAGASVTFMPQAGGRPATGVTDAEGRYRLTTVRSDDGAPLGTYSVTIAKTETPAASADKFGLSGAAAPPSGEPRQLLPVRYAKAQDSGLIREVKAGSNELDFDLTAARD